MLYSYAAFFKAVWACILSTGGEIGPQFAILLDEQSGPFRTRVIYGLYAIGKGQRMGKFAGRGVGQSTLMGMIAKNKQWNRLPGDRYEDNAVYMHCL